jgi:hypothetical protein
METVPRCNASCAASHGPSATATKARKLLLFHRTGAEHGREYEVIEGEQRGRVQERPREPRDAAEIAREQLATEEIPQQRAIARQRHGVDRCHGPAVTPRKIAALTSCRTRIPESRERTGPAHAFLPR